jgi:hypothetical protein
MFFIEVLMPRKKKYRKKKKGEYLHLSFLYDTNNPNDQERCKVVLFTILTYLILLST